MKLTQSAVDGFQAPKGKADHIEFFEGAPGFGLRIRKSPENSERRTFVYQYKLGEQHRRLTLGDARKVKIGAAKEAMTIHAGEIAKGRDPAQDRAKERDQAAQVKQEAARTKAFKTFSQHVPDYLDHCRPNTKPRSFVEIERYLTDDYWKPLHSLALGAIDRAMVAAQLKVIGKERGTTPASHARIALSSFFRWAIGEGLCDSNPVVGTNKPPVPEARDRVLTDAELAAVWSKAPDSEYGRIVRLLALTGQRRDEIGSLRWSEISGLDDSGKALITLPAARTKNGRPHDVPLSAEAVKILKSVTRREKRDLVFGEGEGGFSGWSKAKQAFDTELGKDVKAWRLHDLRRTAATRMGDSAVQPHVIEAVLNHVSGHRAGVAGVYQRSAYSAEKRQALDTLASYIKTAAAKAAGGNVTRLRRA